MLNAPNAAKRLPTAAQSRTNERSFRPDIEGLRAIAIALVMLNHAGLTWLPGGYVGVDVFFVLSGFLITGVLLRELEASGSVSLPGFYARRARRLLPAGALVLLGTVIATHIVIGGARAARTAEDARWTALFLANVHFIRVGTDYMNSTLPPSPLQHFWSLAVEEQFYLVWPLILILIGKVARGRSVRKISALVLFAIVASSLIWSIVQTNQAGTVAYFSPLTRAWELGLGGLLALASPLLGRLPQNLGSSSDGVGLVAIGFAAIRFGPTTVFPGASALVPVLGTCLVIASGATLRNGRVQHMLSAPPLMFTGRISYSLYLWHWPVLIIGAAWIGHDPGLTANLALCGLAILLAYLTYSLLEEPVRDSVRLKRCRPRVSLAMGAALTASVLVVATSAIALTPSMPTLAADEHGSCSFLTTHKCGLRWRPGSM